MRYTRLCAEFLAVTLTLLLPDLAAVAQTRNMTPYAQADTSSPRATLRTFLEGIEQNLANDQ